MKAEEMDSRVVGSLNKIQPSSQSPNNPRVLRMIEAFTLDSGAGDWAAGAGSEGIERSRGSMERKDPPRMKECCSSWAKAC